MIQTTTEPLHELSQILAAAKNLPKTEDSQGNVVIGRVDSFIKGKYPDGTDKESKLFKLSQIAIDGNWEHGKQQLVTFIELLLNEITNYGFSIHQSNFIRQLISMGTERRDLEFKSAFSWTDTNSIWLKEKVICAILAMTNKQDGGVIVIGVNNNNQPVGMSDQQIESFSNYESIKGAVDGFSSTATDFRIQSVVVDGKQFIAMIVNEFEEYPILCTKNGVIHNLRDTESKTGPKYVLKENVLYVRSLKAYFSSQMASADELREIVDLTVDKQTRRLQARGWFKECPHIPIETDCITRVSMPAKIFDDEISDMGV